MPSYEDDLIKRARELQRLATQGRKLRRQLKANEAAIRMARKHLNAIKQASAGRRPDVAPSRLFAGVTGLVMPAKGEDQTPWTEEEARSMGLV